MSSDWPSGPGGWVRVAQLAELGLLSSTLLHELRQPLFAVKAIAQLRRVRGEAVEGEELTEILRNLRAVEELLDLYSGFGRIDETVEAFDLHLPVRRALAMMTHRARTMRVGLHADLCSGSMPVRGRSGALRQVTVNLIQNGLDAAREAGRDTPSVWVRSARDHERATLWVEDNGTGIDASMESRLFEPFATSKPDGKGTGLGLFIARKLVQEAGGELAIGDRDGCGVRVRVDVPLLTEGTP
jgi:C4-dicarboxylate-specific signal transduction histidine kinase